MKRNLLISVLVLFALVSTAQDAKVILQKSYDKCQSVQNGYYEMTKYMKFMSNIKDTFETSFNCYFKKLKDDSIYSSAFHYKAFYKGEYTNDVMYTGDDFVRIMPKDSSAMIMAKSQWAKEIESYKHNYTFYVPLTNQKSSVLKHDSDFVDTNQIFRYIGEEKVNGFSSYHIRVNINPENDSTEMMKNLRIEFNYWINKDDFIPVQYTIEYDILMNNDSMYQYEKYVLHKYEINNLKDEKILTLKSIPDFYKTKDYVPYKSPDPLPKDTIAPGWELFSLTDEKISLNDLKGQLVLIDFFYKSCYPCMQALPALQALHDKYKSKGLRVIGIDPYDKKESGIAAFLGKRGVTYTVLLGGKDAAKDYRVSGYPTMYLIDRKGKIIFIQVGYGKGVEDTLEEIIKKNL
ncbi:MAG: TlpA disulfide reductase family protein [Bacteroidota bacterium]|nr:TlpA disulfide reductase family protein [Bacteroidota bacterium]